MKPKRHFAFTIDIWDDVGDSIIKHLASIDNFEGACACYEEVVKQWPAARIMLRQGARVRYGAAAIVRGTGRLERPVI